MIVSAITGVESVSNFTFTVSISISSPVPIMASFESRSCRRSTDGLAGWSSGKRPHRPCHHSTWPPPAGRQGNLSMLSKQDLQARVRRLEQLIAGLSAELVRLPMEKEALNADEGRLQRPGAC